MMDRMELYEQGYNDRQIAEVVGVTSATIRNWRINKGLKPNRTYGKERHYIKKRPLWEKKIINRCIGDLLGLCDKHCLNLGKREISNYFDIWREKGGIT